MLKKNDWTPQICACLCVQKYEAIDMQSRAQFLHLIVFQPAKIISHSKTICQFEGSNTCRKVIFVINGRSVPPKRPRLVFWFLSCCSNTIFFSSNYSMLSRNLFYFAMSSDDASQVVVLIDVNPFFWGRRSTSSTGLTFNQFLQNVSSQSTHACHLCL